MIFCSPQRKDRWTLLKKYYLVLDEISISIEGDLVTLLLLNLSLYSIKSQNILASRLEALIKKKIRTEKKLE